MSNAILVVGGGFSGLTAAIEAAELGHDVYIVEKTPFLGGRVAQLNKYFPKLCPPSCGLEIQFQRIRNNPRIKFFTLAQVTALSGTKGDYAVQVTVQPRYTAPHNADLGLFASALEGETAKMVIIKRVSNSPYKSELALAPVDQVANAEKKVPTSMIVGKTHMDPSFREYLAPLIQGEVYPRFKNGIYETAVLKKVKAR